MKLHVFLALFWLLAVASADVIHLSNGQDIKGTVTGYGNMAFTITLDNGSEVRQPVSAIKSIEFSTRHVKFELRGRNPVEGAISSFQNGAFSVQTPDGKTEQVLALQITGATFSGSLKKYMMISGGGAALDLKKILAPGKVTVIEFFDDANANCKKMRPLLDNLNKEDAELVLRRVDIVKIGTPVTKQFDIKTVPRVHIYDRNGKEIGRVTGLGIEAVQAYIRAAKEGQ